MNWTHKSVAARITEAAATLKRLRVSGLIPKEYGSTWPEIIHSTIEITDWLDVEIRVGPPMPDAISRMDEVFGWLRILDKDQMILVWLYAENVPRKIICAKVGMSRDKAWKVWVAALMTIATILNAKRERITEVQTLEEKFHVDYRRSGNASESYRAVFPCDGLTDHVVHARAYRMLKKCVPSVDRCASSKKLTKTDAMFR